MSTYSQRNEVLQMMRSLRRKGMLNSSIPDDILYDRFLAEREKLRASKRKEYVPDFSQSHCDVCGRTLDGNGICKDVLCTG